MNFSRATLLSAIRHRILFISFTNMINFKSGSNKLFGLFFFAFIAFELLSFWLHQVQNPLWSSLAAIGIGLLAFCLTLKNPASGLALAAAELIVGAHGHLLNWQFGSQTISVRMT